MSQIICTIIHFTSYEPLKVKMSLIIEPPRTGSLPLYLLKSQNNKIKETKAPMRPRVRQKQICKWKQNDFQIIIVLRESYNSNQDNCNWILRVQFTGIKWDKMSHKYILYWPCLIERVCSFDCSRKINSKKSQSPKQQAQRFAQSLKLTIKQMVVPFKTPHYDTYLLK